MSNKLPQKDYLTRICNTCHQEKNIKDFYMYSVRENKVSHNCMKCYKRYKFETMYVKKHESKRAAMDSFKSFTNSWRKK